VIVFADPVGWWLLGLAAALLMLALARWRRRTVTLTTFFLLRRLAREVAVLPWRVRLLRHLAFLLAAAAMLALAVAGFRPQLVREVPELRAVLVVDRSPGLGADDGGRPRIELLRAALARYLEDVQDDDTLFVVAAGPGAGVSPRLRGAEAARRWVGGLRPADAPVAVGEAAAQAAAIAVREGARVVLFTDLPARWAGDPGARALMALAPRVVAFGAPRENAGIVAFEVRPDPQREGRHELYARLARHVPGGGAAAAYTLRVENNGKRIAEVARRLGDGEEGEVLLRGLELAPGSVEALLEPPDAWAADNRAVAGLGGEEGVRVAVSAGASRYLDEAVRALPGLAIRVLDPQGSQPARPDEIAVLEGTMPPGALPGRALLIMPDREIEGLVQRGFLPPPERVDGEARHPLLRGVDLEQLAVKGFIAYAPGEEYQAVVTADGHPIVLAAEDRGRRLVVVAFDPARTSTVYAPAFPILVANSVRWLAQMTASGRTWFRAGEVVRLPGAAAGGSVRLPDGSVLPLAAGGASGPLVPADAAGRYAVTGRGGRRLGEFYVNVADPRATASIADAGTGRGAAAAVPGPRRPLGRRDLVPWVALLALALLAVEARVRPSPRSWRSGT
jgi:hypothetical protein